MDIAKIDPNFNEIRALYPDEIPVVIKAVKSRKYRIAGSVVMLEIDGEEKAYDQRILLITYNAKEGQHVASKNGTVVSLDLTLTDELKKEGLARDIIRNIQDARKQMGLEIMDRIKVEFAGFDDEEWTEAICKETLADIAVVGEPEVTLNISSEFTDDVVVKIGR